VRRKLVGLFDEVVCQYPLPVEGANQRMYQTKSFELPYLQHYVIRRDGTLWEEPSEGDAVFVDYTGEVRFYRALWEHSIWNPLALAVGRFTFPPAKGSSTGSSHGEVPGACTTIGAAGGRRRRPTHPSIMAVVTLIGDTIFVLAAFLHKTIL